MQPPAADGEVMASGPALLSHERGRLGGTAGSAQALSRLDFPRLSTRDKPAESQVWQLHDHNVADRNTRKIVWRL